MKVTVKIYDECVTVDAVRELLTALPDGISVSPAAVGAVLQEFAVNNWCHLKILEAGVFSLTPMSLRSELVEFIL